MESVRVLTRDGQREKTYGWDDLHYGESDSIFMHNGDIILGVRLHLSHGNVDEIKRAMDEHQLSRRTKQPLDKRSVSTKHPDFVVNNGHATCQDVLAVLHEVQRRVMDQFNVHIPLDVRILGDGVHQER